MQEGQTWGWLCCPQSHQALTGSGCERMSSWQWWYLQSVVPHTFPPPQLKSRHGTFLGSIWDVLLLTQAQLLLPLTAPPSVLCPCPCSTGSTWAGGPWPLPAACSHRKLALPEGSLLPREMGPVTLGRLLVWHIPAGSARSPGQCHSSCPQFLQHCLFPLPTPSCSICRRYFPSVAIWAVSFLVPVSIFCAVTAACKCSLTRFLGHPRHLGNLKCLGK